MNVNETMQFFRELCKEFKQDGDGETYNYIVSLGLACKQMIDNKEVIPIQEFTDEMLEKILIKSEENEYVK
ncbi:hypothetical protein LAU42_07280 [Macrococcus armenti]|uniref:hypothetical protein n=1 Tax=Macrococcus armenti TaxID=2875764 RepID=UPI001CCE7889|nr:hypothetical protein [Macrococcus armenti]UBH21598.1 hypothetical protein LAU42_07280 [Macrococcus armenti]